jgi:hypothetical protein
MHSADKCLKFIYSPFGCVRVGFQEGVERLAVAPPGKHSHPFVGRFFGSHKFLDEALNLRDQEETPKDATHSDQRWIPWVRKEPYSS